MFSHRNWTSNQDSRSLCFPSPATEQLKTVSCGCCNQLAQRGWLKVTGWPLPAAAPAPAVTEFFPACVSQFPLFVVVLLGFFGMYVYVVLCVCTGVPQLCSPSSPFFLNWNSSQASGIQLCSSPQLWGYRQSLRCQFLCCFFFFLRGGGLLRDLNSGPHAYRGSILLTDLSLVPPSPHPANDSPTPVFF